MTNHTPESLIAFTERVKAAFLDKQIHAPVHLNSETQAEPLIEIFKSICPQDYVFSTWRSTYHALLKGVPEEEVFDAIKAGRSMFLMFKEHRVFCSAIVGGILPIALGVAAGIRRKLSVCGCNLECSSEEIRKQLPCPVHKPDGYLFPLIYVFIGDMAYRTGLYHEFAQYAHGHSLPIRVVLENNSLSTNAVTEDTWGCPQIRLPVHKEYKYQRTTPHVGIGQRVTF